MRRESAVKVVRELLLSDAGTLHFKKICSATAALQTNLAANAAFINWLHLWPAKDE